jgi:hypothetical protein
MTTDFGGHPLPAENGFKVVMAIGAGSALLAFVIASFIPRRHIAPQEGPATDGPADTSEVAEAKV